MSTSTIKTKVQKLLAKAASTEGTPESDIFYAKAFELMARHGFTESELSNADSTGMDYETWAFSGAYTDMQLELLNAIATALHCACVGTRKYRGIRISKATVYGARTHLERVGMLFSILGPMMLGLALDHTGANGRSIVACRRSFMQGFVRGIRRRLDVAENKVAEEEPGYAVQLRDESHRAEEFMREKLAKENAYVKRHRSQRRFDPHAYVSGDRAARNTDIGQTRVPSRRALPM